MTFEKWLEADEVANGFYCAPGSEIGKFAKKAYEAGKRDAPREAIGRILTEVMDAAVSNGADSRSMPDDYVAVAAWLCDIKPQSAPKREE